MYRTSLRLLSCIALYCTSVLYCIVLQRIKTIVESISEEPRFGISIRSKTWWWWWGFFFSHARTLGGSWTSHSPHALFFKWRLACTHQFHSVRISPQWLSWLRRLHTMPEQHSQPTPTSLGQDCLGVTCQLHFWQNDRGLLRTTVLTRGVEQTKN